MTHWTDEDRREYERLVKIASDKRRFFSVRMEAWAAIERSKNAHGGTSPPKPPSTPETSP